MIFPKNDEFKAFCVTNGYPPGYNDCMVAYLRDIMGMPNASLPDLVAKWDGNISGTPVASKSMSFTSEIPSDWTYSRTFSATYCNSSGVLSDAADDIPRFDYDPTTLAFKGLLLEGQSVNNLDYSESFKDSGWYGETRLTATDDVATSPDGTTNAASIIESGTGSHSLFKNIAVPAVGIGEKIAASVWAKVGPGPATRFLQFMCNGSALSSAQYAGFDLTTGAVNVNGSPSISANSFEYPNDWWRCEFVLEGDAGGGPGTINLNIRIADSASAAFNSYAGDGTSGLYIFGAQLERAELSTSYIRTSGAAQTRGADNLSMSGSAFSKWYNPGAGSFVMDFVSGTTNSNLLTVSDGTSDNSYFFGKTASTTTTMTITTATVGQFSSALTTNGDHTDNKFGFSYKEDDVTAAANNVLGTNDTSVTLPTVNQIVLNGGTNTRFHIKSLDYYNNRLPDATMQSLTT